ncbi:glutathione hydrolase 1 proenzyme-like [Saccoglossus kowalevskii]
MLCNGIINTQSHGIGGGHFMVIYKRDRDTIEAIDAREEAPLESAEDMYSENPEDATLGGKAIGVPGEVDGFWMAHMRHGRLPWKELFTASIKLAEEGFEIGPALGGAISDKEEDIRREQGLREIFLNEDGSLKKTGDVMHRYKLAQTYRKIASGGAEEFYTGRLADDIVADIRDNDGIIVSEDLRNYRAKLKEPLKIILGEYDVYSPRPPASGAVLSLILNILEGYNFNEDSTATESSKILTSHRIVEAFKFAYAKRTMLGDEDYIDIVDLIANMTSDEYAENLRMLIDDDRTHEPDYYGADYYTSNDGGTSHLSVVDEDGNAVAVTSTINLYFGSKVRGLRTGIIFNNEMDDFSSPNITNSFGVPPSPANFIEPGKRPLSSMSPTIVIDKHGDVQLVVGASGGTKITTISSLVSARTLWFGEDIETAITGPRFHHQLIPNKVDYEEGIEETTLDGWISKGHDTDLRSSLAVCSAIRRVTGGLSAFSDERKAGGYPAGY